MPPTASEMISAQFSTDTGASEQIFMEPEIAATLPTATAMIEGVYDVWASEVDPQICTLPQAAQMPTATELLNP